MKSFLGTGLSLLVSFATLLCVVSSSANAQGSSVKAHYIRALKAQIKLSERAHDYKNVQKLKELEPIIQNSSEEDFSKYSEINQQMESLAENAEQFSESLTTAPASTFDPVIVNSSSLQTTLSNAQYSNICGSNRQTPELMFAALNVYLLAEAVREAALRGCQETVVIAGFGGNGSAVCLITDAVFIAAKVFFEELNFCQTDIEYAEIGATYKRAADNFNLMNEHHRVITNQLNNHDNAARSALSKHDLEVKNSIQSHDQDIKSRLNDLEAKLDKLQGSVDRNSKLLEEVIILLNTPAGRRPDWPAK